MKVINATNNALECRRRDQRDSNAAVRAVLNSIVGSSGNGVHTDTHVQNGVPNGHVAEVRRADTGASSGTGPEGAGVPLLRRSLKSLANSSLDTRFSGQVRVG